MRPRIIYIVLSSFLIGIFISSTASAQEEDTYSDYSYLWEDTKKKKKKKKQKPVEVTPQTVNIPTQQAPIETAPILPMDSANLVASPLIDTLTNIAPAVDGSVVGVEPEETEDIVPKEKNSAAPSDDFRAGLPGSEPKSTINASLGYTNIAGENFVGLTLAPEFNFGKVGLGLHVPILYNLNSNEVRTEIFEDGVGPARLIRYVRYGTQKRDPYYFRIGELDNIMMGFGGLVNNYSNTTSYEKRKLGLHFDVNYRGLGGIEGMYSDFDPSSLNLFAIRPYVRPLATTGIPVASTLEIGATYLTDKDQTKIPTSDSTSAKYLFTKPGISAFNIDAGITVLKIPFIQIDIFGGFTKLNVSSAPLTNAVASLATLPGASDVLTDGFKNGQGFSAGVNFRFHFIADILSTDLRIERLSYKDHFLPQFFDTSYELNKDLRILTLASAEKQGGIYGSLTGHIIQKVKLGGSLMIPDDISVTSPALVRLHADVERLANKISLHGSYVKGNLATLKDAFKFDENSLAKVRFVYHMNKFLTAGVDYYWAFALDENGAYKATSYVSPYFGVSIEL